MKYGTRFIALLALVAVGTAQAQSATEIPGRINYQGRLVQTVIGPPDVSEPLPSGQYDMEFRIYDDVDDDPAPAQLLWGPQTFDGNDAVPLVSGYFGVVLSEDDNGISIAEAFADGAECYIEAKATVDVSEHILGPRERILGTAYAVKARHGVAPGAVAAHAGPTAPPGWLLCDGAAVEQAEYPALYEAIGDYWGSDTGSTFVLPDLRGRFLSGAGSTGGWRTHPMGYSTDEAGSLQDDSATGHTHDMSHHTHGSSRLFLKLNVLDRGNTTLPPPPDEVYVAEVNTSDWAPSRRIQGLSQVDPVGADSESRGVYLGGTTGAPNANDVGAAIAYEGSVPAETRPKNVYVNYIIKY